MRISRSSSGPFAGLCSTASFVPQVVKSGAEGDTGAISKRMYIVTVSAFTLWIAYGLMIWSVPIIVFKHAQPRLVRLRAGDEAAQPAPPAAGEART